MLHRPAPQGCSQRARGAARQGGHKIVVVAATNRYDILDEALCRPGRFDRVIRCAAAVREMRVSAAGMIACSRAAAAAW